jgi:hypothetical protein
MTLNFVKKHADIKVRRHAYKTAAFIQNQAGEAKSSCACCAPPIYAWMQQTRVEREKGFPEAYMVLPVF